eukprot:scaffold135150_cov69-Phaeocystis_antarctica.AAC.1
MPAGCTLGGSSAAVSASVSPTRPCALCSRLCSTSRTCSCTRARTHTHMNTHVQGLHAAPMCRLPGRARCARARGARTVLRQLLAVRRWGGAPAASLR